MSSRCLKMNTATLNESSLDLLNASYPSLIDDEMTETGQGIQVNIPYWTVRWLIATMSIMCNGLLIILIASRPNLRTIRNWFVLSLAAADFLVGAFNCLAEFLQENYGVSRRIDIPHPYFLDVSSTCLVAMTLDRYMAVIHPFKYQSFMTKRHMTGLIVLSWLIPLFIRLPLVIGLADRSATLYFCFTVILLRGLPLVLLPTTFARVVLVARRMKRQTDALRMQVAFNHEVETQDTDRQQSATERIRQSSVHATAAAIVFYCCSNAIDVWDMITHALMPGYTISDYSQMTNTVGLVLLNLNSAVNCAIYGFFQSEFRSELKAFIRYSSAT